jgi:hypothetical protein
MAVLHFFSYHGLENPSATHEQATGRFLETDWRRLENIKKKRKKKPSDCKRHRRLTPILASSLVVSCEIDCLLFKRLLKGVKGGGGFIVEREMGFSVRV